MSPNRKVMYTPSFIRASSVGKSVKSDTLLDYLHMVAKWQPTQVTKGKPGKKGVTYVRNRRTKNACVVRGPVNVAKLMEASLKRIFESPASKQQRFEESVRLMGLTVARDNYLGDTLTAKIPARFIEPAIFSRSPVEFSAHPPRMDFVREITEEIDRYRQPSKRENVAVYTAPMVDLSDDIMDNIGLRGFVGKDGDLKIDSFNIINPGV